MKTRNDAKFLAALTELSDTARAYRNHVGTAQQHTLDFYVTELSESVEKLSACLRKMNVKLLADCLCAGLTSAGCRACQLRQSCVEILEGDAEA